MVQRGIGSMQLQYNTPETEVDMRYYYETNNITLEDFASLFKLTIEEAYRIVYEYI
jgi:hypothetical protein